MTIHHRLLFIAAVFVLWTFSCTKPVLIGSDFLEDEKASLAFKDDFDLSFFTEKTDSVIVHSDNVSLQLSRYLCGNIQDPVFGDYLAEMYVQPFLPTVATDLIGSTFDSVVLSLRYDTLGTYGTLANPVTIEVYRMIENPDFKDDVYSNHRFLTSTDLLGSATFLPRPKDSVTVFHPLDTIKTAAHIRIPLDLVKMSELLEQDSNVFKLQDTFLNYFNGLYIKMSDGSNTMLGFNVVNSVSGLTFYFDKDTILDQQFRFVFTTGSIKTVYMEHDYTGSIVEAALTPEPENDLWFVQGLSGVTSYMKVDGLDALGNVIVNLAELEIFSSFPPGDMEDLYPSCPYIVTQHKTDTSIVNSTDVNIGLNLTSGDHTSENYDIIFGGKLKEVEPGPPAIYKYTMKVTTQLKDIIEGNKENIIYFNPFDKGEVPNRSVFFGPNHPIYAPRLKIYYTAL